MTLKAKVRRRRADRYKKVWRKFHGLFADADTSKGTLREHVKRASRSAAARERPRPMEKKAHHGLLGEFVNLVLPYTEADPASLVIQFLIAFGNLIGRTAHFSVEDDRHHLNLFGVLVGRSAKARKGVSWHRVRSVFTAVAEDWAKERIQSGLSSGEGLMWALRDPIREWNPKKEQEVIVDLGDDDKRLLVTEPEFASVLKVMKREGNTLSTLLRLAWDGDTLQTLTKNSPLKATNPHISVVGHITEPDLKRHLTETDAANGFGNRFLWICTERSKLLPEGGTVPPSKLKEFLTRLKKAVVHAKSVGELKRDERAKKRWAAVYEELGEERDGLHGALTSRAEPQVMRMACLYALLDRKRTVSVEHLEAALAVWRYADASVGYIFGDSLGDPVADGILAALIETPEGLTLSEIHDLFSRRRSAEQIKTALERLSNRGLARGESEPTAGRPVERWFGI